MMRTKLLTAAAMALSVTATGLYAQRQLTLMATVTDPGGGEVAALTPGDIKFAENGTDGKALQVEAIDSVPKLQILIDNGVGVGAESLTDLRNGVRGLIEALPLSLEVTLVTTAPQPRFLERATTDHAKLLSAVNRIAPDSGAGRFAESLYEATDRIGRDEKGRYTIIAFGTTSGDSQVRESDVQKTVQRVSQRGTTVHVVLLTSMRGAASGGVLQEELGQLLANNSRGRFEKIAVPNRVATLLPEIGAEVAKSLGGSSRQFRITVERPNGASGDLGKMSLGVVGKLVSNVSVAGK
jgi:hypothetical protein